MKTLHILAFACVLTGALAARAQSPVPVPLGPAPSVMDDPEWQKRFLGSYGFMPALEPKVNQDELVVLRDLIELMKTDPAAAAEQLSASINEGSSAALVFVTGNLYFQAGNLPMAEKYYEMAVSKHPDFRRAHKNLGLLYVQEQDYDKAIRHLSRAVELGEYDGRNYGLLGYCYLATNHYLSAEQAYREAILAEPSVSDWQLGLVRVLLETERYGEAISLLDALIAASPDEGQYWLLQANAYLGQGKPLEAAVDLEALRGMGKARQESLLLLGDIYMNLRMAEAAKDAYLEALASDANRSGFRFAFRAATLLQQTGNDAQAAELVSQIEQTYAGALDNEEELKLLTLQAKIARARGDEEKAVAWLESIVTRDGTRGEALLELASHYEDQGDRERALLYLERAENLQDFEYEALVKHAQMLTRSKDYPAAAALLRRALNLRQDARIERFLEQIERAARG